MRNHRSACAYGAGVFLLASGLPASAVRADLSVTIASPTAGAVYESGNKIPPAPATTPVNVQWNVPNGTPLPIKSDLSVSFDDGATFKPIVFKKASNALNDSFTWWPANRPTTKAKFKIKVTDNGNNTAESTTGQFEIKSVGTFVVNTSLSDFDMPGTQPLGHLTSGVDIHDPTDCQTCHEVGDAATGTGPFETWRGSLMAHASVDPLFTACLEIANQDAAESGDMCIRCHLPRAWLNGRSTPTDMRAAVAGDRIGVACDICHRMVDPIASNLNPAIDGPILAALGAIGELPTVFGTGDYVIDPDVPQAALPGDDANYVAPRRRGPFNVTDTSHTMVKSVFHQESAMCGTCHDVSNPALSKDGGNYVLNALNTRAGGFGAGDLMPIERTYSEWLNSKYASTGVYAPEFAGNKPGGVVSSCQDCHMRDVNDVACNLGVDARPDMPLHDLTGGSTWLPQHLTKIPPYSDLAAGPKQALQAALDAGVVRAKATLEKAADITASVVACGTKLVVTVTNKTGHKLPTGYPEGRRMWLSVEFYDFSDQLLRSSGSYDFSTAVLDKTDPEVKIYEAELGLTDPVGGIPAGKSFHFVLNNKVLKDNRIPPQGFTNATFAAFGGAPVAATYADGQYWDDTLYTIPADTDHLRVNLYYQSASKEYIEFLKAANERPGNGKGGELHDLWNNNGKCPPHLMEQFEGVLSGTFVRPEGILWAVSRKAQCGYNDFDIDALPMTGQTSIVECRKGGPTKLIVMFDTQVTTTSGSITIGDEVKASAGTIGSVTLEDAQKLTINLSGVPDATCLKITLHNFKRLSNNSVIPDAVLNILSLYGDVTGDRIVNIADLAYIKDYLGKRVIYTNLRADVDTNCILNIADMNEVKNNFRGAVACP